jgi:DNA-binding transcriptional MerR regulator
MTEYTIDELAHAADTTVRNIRAYQQKKLLPAPRRAGRANLYSDVHVARLRLIGRLLARGYTLANISEMLHTFEKGEAVSDLLGLETALTSPFSTELPSYVTLLELARLFGARIAPRDLDHAVQLGILRRDHGRFLVPSPRLLHVGAELVRAGIPLSSLLLQVAQLRDDARRIADRFVHLIIDEVFNRYGEEAFPPASERPRITEFVYRVRPMAQTVVEVELARALEASIHTAFGHRLARIAEAEQARSERGASETLGEGGSRSAPPVAGSHPADWFEEP